MIEYGGCVKGELISAVESLAYKVLHYEHPNWIEIPEEEIYRLLREESLSVYLFSDNNEDF